MRFTQGLSDEVDRSGWIVRMRGYYWDLSRYIHLNPCNDSKPLAETPESCPYSRFGGYSRVSRRLDWVAYDEHRRYWSGRNGGEDFLKRVFSMAEGDDPATHRRRVRRANSVGAEAIISATAQQYGVTPDEYTGFRNGATGRDMAVYLCRRFSRATLQELSERFGLSHPASPPRDGLAMRQTKIRVNPELFTAQPNRVSLALPTTSLR